MTELLTVEQYLAATAAAVDTIVEQWRAAGPQDPVPTCPEWTMRDLLAHHGMVLEWARSTLSAGGQLGDAGETEALGLAVPDQGAWLHERFAAFAAELRAMPEDAQAFVFLKNSPAPRLFWARRQGHEATIHAIDALAARLDRVPDSSELEIDQAFAADGIDEVLSGFAPRRSGALRSPEPLRVNVIPTDHEARWGLIVSEEPVQTSRHTLEQADVTLKGPAAQLYAGLWNRGELPSSDPAFVAQWRTQMSVSFG